MSVAPGLNTLWANWFASDTEVSDSEPVERKMFAGLANVANTTEGDGFTLPDGIHLPIQHGYGQSSSVHMAEPEVQA